MRHDILVYRQNPATKPGWVFLASIAAAGTLAAILWPRKASASTAFNCRFWDEVRARLLVSQQLDSGVNDPSCIWVRVAEQLAPEIEDLQSVSAPPDVRCLVDRTTNLVSVMMNERNIAPGNQCNPTMAPPTPAPPTVDSASLYFPPDCAGAPIEGADWWDARAKFVVMQHAAKVAAGTETAKRASELVANELVQANTTTECYESNGQFGAGWPLSWRQKWTSIRDRARVILNGYVEKGEVYNPPSNFKQTEIWFAPDCSRVVEGTQWWDLPSGMSGPGQQVLWDIWNANGGESGPPLEAGAVATEIVERFGEGTPCVQNRNMWSTSMKAWYQAFVERVNTWLES